MSVDSVVKTITFSFREFDLTIGVKDSFNFRILCIYISQSIGRSKTLRIRISTLNYRKSLAKSRLVILFFQRFLSMFLPSYSRIYSIFSQPSAHWPKKNRNRIKCALIGLKMWVSRVNFGRPIFLFETFWNILPKYMQCGLNESGHKYFCARQLPRKTVASVRQTT